MVRTGCVQRSIFLPVSSSFSFRFGEIDDVQAKGKTVFVRQTSSGHQMTLGRGACDPFRNGLGFCRQGRNAASTRSDQCWRTLRIPFGANVLLASGQPASMHAFDFAAFSWLGLFTVMPKLLRDAIGRSFSRRDISHAGQTLFCRETRSAITAEFAACAFGARGWADFCASCSSSLGKDGKADRRNGSLRS